MTLMYPPFVEYSDLTWHYSRAITQTGPPTLDDTQMATFLRLYKKGLIPLYVCLPALTIGLYDYFVTLPDEIKYILPQKRTFGRAIFYWIRYYTLLLLVFDVAQIHSFRRPEVPTVNVCLAMDPTIRVVSAASLWAVEIMMQVRVWALYERSRKIAIYNALLFLGSIAAFIWVMVYSAQNRRLVISAVAHLPLPGCPTINGGIRWAVWVPATVFEFNLFCLALYKSVLSSYHSKVNRRETLVKVLIKDNVLFFLGITLVLIITNVMAVGTPHIPWFGFAPFHAALGIMTCRMHMHLVKFSADKVEHGSTTRSGDSSYYYDKSRQKSIRGEELMFANSKGESVTLVSFA